MTLYASTFYNGDGATTSFVIAFPYILETDVEAFVAGVPYGGVVTYPDSTHINLSPAPPAGIGNVLIQRHSVGTTLLSTIQNGTIAAADINLDETQMLYLIQELSDAGFLAPNIISGARSGLIRPVTASGLIYAADDIIEANASAGVVVLTYAATLGSPLSGAPVTIAKIDTTRNAVQITDGVNGVIDSMDTPASALGQIGAWRLVWANGANIRSIGVG